MQPDISVVVPVYNVEKYLEDCIESIVLQEGPSYEIICVNDGSTDGSAEILEKLTQKYNTIKVIFQENQGLSGARNTGIKNSQGKYIAFLDSDDMFAPNALSKMFKLAEENFLDFLTFDAECLYETRELRKKEIKDGYYQRLQSYGIGSGHEIFARFIEDHKFCDAAWILFCNRKWLLENHLQFYPRLIHEDCLFSFQCYMAANRVMHINERLVLYRIRENSIMTSKLGFKSVYGKVVCVHYFMEYYYTHQKLPKRYLEAIRSWADQITLTAVWGSDYLDDKDKRKIKNLEGVFGVDARHMGLKLKEKNNSVPIDYDFYTEAFVHRIASCGKCMIYGAGIRGKRLLEYLKLKEIDTLVSAFLVTNIDETINDINGIPIMPIDSVLINQKDMLIIVAVGGGAATDIKEVLLDKGFNNILVLDDMISRVMQKAVGKVRGKEQLNNVISLYQNVWIYGAGQVAQEMWDALERENIEKIKGILVTDAKDNGNFFHGKSVYQYSAQLCKQEDLIVIAVGNVLKQEVINYMEQDGHYNYIVLRDFF